MWYLGGVPALRAGAALLFLHVALPVAGLVHRSAAKADAAQRHAGLLDVTRGGLKADVPAADLFTGFFALLAREAPAAEAALEASTAKDAHDWWIVIAVVAPLVSLTVWMSLVVFAAFLYHRHKLTPIVDVDSAKSNFGGEDFKHSPFRCFEDMETCCWSCWCGGVRWADTMNAVGLFSFWLAILTYLVICFLETCTGGITVWVLVALFFTYFRQELRKKLNMRNDGETIFKDFLLWCCCIPCAIAQEARQIKEAPASEVPALNGPVPTPQQQKLPVEDQADVQANMAADLANKEGDAGSTGGAA